MRKSHNTHTEGSSQPSISWKKIRKLLAPTYKKHGSRLLIGFIALISVDFLQLMIPRIIKYGVDGLENGSIQSAGLAKLGGIILTIATCVVFLRIMWRYLIIGFSRLLEKSIRVDIFRHLIKMDSPFFEKRTTGDLMAHSSNDLGAVQMACGMGMVAAVDSFVISLAAIGFMIAISPTLTLYALLPMPFLALATKILSAKLHHRFMTVQEQFAQLTEFCRTTLISIGLIKAYTMEDFQTKRFDTLGKKYVANNLKVATIHGLMSPIATLIGSVGMLMVLYFGGRLVIFKEISLGDFVAFITYLYMLIWPMMAIGWVANLVQRGRTSLARINSLLTSEPQLPAIEENKKLNFNVKEGFHCKNLTFKYSRASSPSLTDITVSFGPGIHGITGRTGSGKSTLCKILARLNHIDNSQLFFNNIDINEIPVDKFRSHIGYVSQEPILFSESIAQNISFAKPNATKHEIETAAMSAAIHTDILDLPDGYKTIIGERGIKLSGGQKQRIALARALLSNRSLLIIDDGLSAVDVTTEHEIFHNLQNHFHKKIVIIVSNRIKLLSMTSRILILEEGTIENDGNHEQLLEKNRLYQSMYKKQMKEDPTQEPDTL